MRIAVILNVFNPLHFFFLIKVSDCCTFVKEPLIFSKEKILFQKHACLEVNFAPTVDEFCLIKPVLIGLFKLCIKISLIRFKGRDRRYSSIFFANNSLIPRLVKQCHIREDKTTKENEYERLEE